MKNDILSQKSIDILLSKELTWGAKGLALYMIHIDHDPNWHKEELRQCSTEGWRRVDSLLRELYLQDIVTKVSTRNEKSGLITGRFWAIK